MTPKSVSKLLLGSFVLVLAACGGGNSSTPPETGGPTPPPPVSAETYVTVTGAIDGFGSVIVNGVRYGTDSAEVRKDGQNADLSDLSVGQTVSLRARKNGSELPTALRVRYEEVLEGPVDSIAADWRSLVILEQIVFLTDDTVYEDDLVLEDIVVGDVLEVSGSFTADGDIVASYVEIADEFSGDYEVHGTVGGLDETAQTFRVKGLKVGYASAELVDFEDGETLSNGDKVEVEGSVFTNDGTLIATRVEFEGDDLEELIGDEAGENDEEEGEIEGFITDFTDSTAFEVNGIAVQTNSDTVFERCEADALALDVEVEVEGTFTDEGVLIAESVKCEVEANQFITALVDDVNETENTLTLLGVTVDVDADTSFQDKAVPRVREFGLDDIAVGDVLRVQLYTLPGDDTFKAKKVRRERADRFDETEVKGDVSVIGTYSLTVTGVEVVLGQNTEFEIDDVETTQEEFLANIQEGDRLVIRGIENANGDLEATSVELDRDDDEGDDD